MRLIRRYYFKEWFSSFLLSLGVFTLAFSIGNLVKLVDLIINKGVKALLVLELFFMMIPFSLVYTIPISTLISTLLIFGRAGADNEIVALKSSGISCKRVGLHFLVLGIILSLISFIFMDKILPYTHYKVREIIFNIGKKNPTAYLEPGTFIKSFKDHIIFFYGLRKNKLKNVRIYVSTEGKPLRTIIAEKAIISKVTDKGLALKLLDGSCDEIDTKNPEKFYKLNFKQYLMTINLDNMAKIKLDKKPEEYTIEELKSNIIRLKTEGIDALPLISEMHKRYAQPFTCLAFILIGLPFGIRAQRREKSIGYSLGLMIIIFYYVLFLSFESLILNKKILPFLGHWMPTLIISIFGLNLYFKMDRVKK